jgi:hypothetical protein
LAVGGDELGPDRYVDRFVRIGFVSQEFWPDSDEDGSTAMPMI